MSQIPFESLPNEIISEILLLLVDRAREDRWMTAGEIRTDLRLVSHLWNDIILSTPSLWTCIEIGINNIFVDSPPFSTIRLLLDRSGELPLELNIDFLTYSPRSAISEKHLTELLDILWESIYRWKNLTVTLEGGSSHPFTLYPYSDATRLRHVKVVVEGELLQEEEAKSLIQSLGDAPALHRLDYSGLDDPAVEAMTRSVPLLNQLTTLRLVVQHYRCVELALHVVHKCASITWISLSSRGTTHWGSIDIDTWPNLHLPNLRILEIGETVILPLFRCPNLQVLSISSKPYLVALQAVSTYISTSKHSLQVLRLKAMQRYDLTWFFRNKDLVRVPILEVHTVWDEKVELDSIRREVLDRMWERFGDSRTPTFAAYGRRVTALGWVDSKVLLSFNEYFENTRKIVLPSGTLSSY